jgi:hypothetical protein
MKRARKTSHETPIRTSFWELIDELSSMTKDDNLVVAAVKSIFHNYGVRHGRSLAPVRLVGAVAPRTRLRVRHG